MRKTWIVLLNLLICVYIGFLLLGPIVVIWYHPTWLTRTMGVIMFLSGIMFVPVVVQKSSQGESGLLSFFLVGNLVAGYAWLFIPRADPFGIAASAYTWLFGWLVIIILAYGGREGIQTDRGP